jgi:hypothetical protein
MPSVKNEDIAQLAYEYWETAGRPDGCALDHWLKAESALNGLSLKERAREAKKLKLDKKDQASPKRRTLALSAPRKR